MVDDPGSALDRAVEEAMAGGGVPDAGEMFDVEAAPLGAVVALDVLARRVPKAELHLHLEGAIRPSTLGRLARRAGIELTAPSSPEVLFDYRGFGKFGADLARAGELLRDADTVVDATLDVLAAEVDAGCRHVELMSTVGFHASRGWDPHDFLRALGDAFDQAGELWDLSGGVIVEFERSAGGTAAEQIASVAGDAADAGLPVLGVGNSGDPLSVPFADLRPGYDAARARGLKLCGHVDMPDDLAPALEFGLDRIDHGYAALFAPDLLAEVVARQVPLTVCLTSNIVQMPGIFADFDVHPVGALAAAGVNCTFHTDDPPYFFTDLAQEYRVAARTLGWDAAELVAAARRSLEAAWLPEAERASRLEGWDGELDAMLADPRWFHTA
jgi:adenosine deaminase